jgi:hypothetical protein
MTLIVTPGADDAESYASIETINDYAVKRGASFPITGEDAPATAAAIVAAEAAARRATAWIDGEYGPMFIGTAASASQALEWPRTGAWFRGEELPSDTIPRQIVEATCEAAIRELAEPGSMSPDMDRGGRIKRERVEGAVEVEYMDGAPAGTDRPLIDGKLSALLTTGNGASVDLLRV